MNLRLKLLWSCIYSCIFTFIISTSIVFSQGKERNILANEAVSIDLAKSLIIDNSWNKLPGYHDRQFWESIPANLRKDYISLAEGYLNYNWPVVKATDYLEFIRSG